MIRFPHLSPTLRRSGSEYDRYRYRVMVHPLLSSLSDHLLTLSLAFLGLPHLLRQVDLEATDARLIGELNCTYVSAYNTDVFTPSSYASQKLVISTPNADYLPNINLGEQAVTFCEDGRWGATDWGQWPQWLFDEQEYYPYILRKPSPEEFKTHPLQRLWWNMSPNDFIMPPNTRLGRLNPTITEEFYEIRDVLSKQVQACECPNGASWSKLHETAANMRACVSSLRFVPQEYLGVLLTVAAAQRYALLT
ncbi:hypothetical protein AN958_09096 [Leucoagaricus sp. SymC.cos]|nr:hypothetical protein AN958_09096 [Leucoagaricus sp. SymC.cos]